jgi:hypothetical protein
VTEQLLLDLEPRVDDLSDLNFELAERLLREAEADAAQPQACTCIPSALVFRPLPSEGPRCHWCGRPVVAP